ncbi:hypothetical protein BH09PAT3_BH09PAT3_6530 [soil metagenome]
MAGSSSGENCFTLCLDSQTCQQIELLQNAQPMPDATLCIRAISMREMLYETYGAGAEEPPTERGF